MLELFLQLSSIFQTYDRTLEEEALKIANTCVFEHVRVSDGK